MERDKKAALVSVCVTAVLAAVKYVVGTLSGSIALVADAIHSLTDVISSAAVVIGLKISDRSQPMSFLTDFTKLRTS